jgi:hypothetical protein
MYNIQGLIAGFIVYHLILRCFSKFTEKIVLINEPAV